MALILKFNMEFFVCVIRRKNKGMPQVVLLIIRQSRKQENSKKLAPKIHLDLL